MPLFATTKTADELKKIGPFAAPERSRARRCMVTHAKGDETDVFVRLQAHGNIYDYAKVRFGDHSPVEQTAPEPLAKIHLPSTDVLNRFPKEDLIELAKCCGATATQEDTKKEIIAAIDARR